MPDTLLAAIHADRLHAIREFRGLSQNELASQSGVSVSRISRYEKDGEEPPGISTGILTLYHGDHEVGQKRIKTQPGSFGVSGSGLTVEDAVFIGPHVVFTNDRSPRAANPDGSLQTAADWILERTTVRRGASIGAGAIVMPGLEIGRSAMVGAGAVVTHDVPAHAVAVGNPARQIGWICVCGRERLPSGPRGEEELRCARCKTATPAGARR